jgi:hypothetical protein
MKCDTQCSISGNDVGILPLLADPKDGYGATTNTNTAACFTATTPPTTRGGSAGRDSLNFSSNVLLVYRLQEMSKTADLSFQLAVVCLAYCALNVTLFFLNYYIHFVREDVMPERAFHMMEFWATFMFSVVECITVVYTPRPLSRIYRNPLRLKIVLFFNIVATLVPALLITINQEEFEIMCHNLEYLNDITMTFIDAILLGALCVTDKNKTWTILLASVPGSLAVLQLVLYNGMGRTPDGDMVGEVPSHFCEFIFGFISGLIAFWFCIDNKLVADEEMGSIMYGVHRDCRICDAQSTEFQRTYYEL